MFRVAAVTANLSAACLAAAPALAHAPIDGIGTFYNGMLHPIVAPSHLILFTGSGLLLGLQSQPLKANAWYVFVITFWIGLALGQTVRPAVPQAFLLSLALVTGLCVALQLSWRASPLFILGALSAVGIGIDSQAESTEQKEIWAGTAGTAIGGVLLLTIVAGLASSLERPWQQIGVRIAGSWIAASACIALAILW